MIASRENSDQQSIAQAINVGLAKTREIVENYNSVLRKKIDQVQKQSESSDQNSHKSN